ncbi:hypothetical protein [Butyricimonas sp. Marseille-P3923]|uniref:hypothetical protein n=1 Tax=Butyricimonas sp. Marseille-P3923 TaxID=1987504 RepID=UPI000C073D82|nr:hypothetical protein [Butyricimonas sp. Marseille-P3923]
MLKSYLLYGVFFISLFGACSTGDDDDVFAAENMIDWFAVQDKPGDVHQLIYDIYKNDHLTVFINDTIYCGDGGVDYFGNPVADLVLFDPGYYVFSTDVFVSIKLSADSAAMLKALRVIREKVVPYLPESGLYRPSSVFLVDSLYKGYNEMGSMLWGEVEIYPGSLKGVTVGKLYEIPGMNDDELAVWAGRILAAKSSVWIQANCGKELEDFEKITNEDKFFGSYYDQNVGTSPWDAPEKQGFFRWQVKLWDNKGYRSPKLEEDIAEYIAYVYAYRGIEAELKERYENYTKVTRKFDIMKALVEQFEASQSVR